VAEAPLALPRPLHLPLFSRSLSSAVHPSGRACPAPTQSPAGPNPLFEAARRLAALAAVARGQCRRHKLEHLALAPRERLAAVREVLDQA
jgi:hypothetical protein